MCKCALCMWLNSVRRAAAVAANSSSFLGLDLVGAALGRLRRGLALG